MENVSVMLEPVRVFLGHVGNFLPRLALAAVVVIGGWLLAKLARIAVDKGLRAVNFNVITERSGMDGFLGQGGIGSPSRKSHRRRSRRVSERGGPRRLPF